MTLFLLSLLVAAGALAGAGVTLYLVGPNDRRDIDELARRDRG